MKALKILSPNKLESVAHDDAVKFEALVRERRKGDAIPTLSESELKSSRAIFSQVVLRTLYPRVDKK